MERALFAEQYAQATRDSMRRFGGRQWNDLPATVQVQLFFVISAACELEQMPSILLISAICERKETRSHPLKCSILHFVLSHTTRHAQEFVLDLQFAHFMTDAVFARLRHLLTEKNWAGLLYLVSDTDFWVRLFVSDLLPVSRIGSACSLRGPTVHLQIVF